MTRGDIGDAGIGDVRRLRWHTIVVRGKDDLGVPAARSVSPEVATSAVLRLRRRAWRTLLVGLVLLVGFVTGASVLEDRFADLEANGGRVTGVVVSVSTGLRGIGDSVDVWYTVNGVIRTGSMNLDDNSPGMEPGAPITGFYDRDDPDRIASPGVSNDPMWATMVMIVALLTSLCLLPCGLIGVGRWTGRAAAARRHGWRRGRAEEGPRHRVVHIRLDGSAGHEAIVLTRPVFLQIPPAFLGGEVLVAGHGRRLAVLFTLGPVLAAAKRTQRRSQ